MPELHLPPVKWDLQKSRTEQMQGGSLGDGYDLLGKVPFSERDDWSLVFPGLSQIQFQEVWGIIQTFAGYENFEWREFEWQETRTYAFDDPSANPYGSDCWEISVTLREIK